MPQLCKCLNFFRYHVRILYAAAKVKDFNCNLLIEKPIVSEVNFPKAAFSKFFYDFYEGHSN